VTTRCDFQDRNAQKMYLRLGLRPRTQLGELTALPIALAGLMKSRCAAQGVKSNLPPPLEKSGYYGIKVPLSC